MTNEITVLSEVEAIRKNPSMYIGSTDNHGAHHMLTELVHNALDESLAGFGQKISVELSAGSAVVQDEGRGIPTELHSDLKISQAEIALTRLHAGSKFVKNSLFTAGLHGVGLSCVNALSENLKVTIRRKGNEYTQEFHLGKSKGTLKNNGSTSFHGTRVEFSPDRTIFKNFKKFDETFCTDLLEEISYLVPKLELQLTVGKKDRIFKTTAGIKGLLALRTKELPVLLPEPITIEFKSEGLQFSSALTWVAQSTHNIFSFVNCVRTDQGGTHVGALQAGLVRALNKALGEDLRHSKIETEEMLEGLHAAFDLRVTEPNFQGQIKARLTNSEVIAPIEECVFAQFSQYLEQNPRLKTILLERIREVRNARAAARRATEKIYFQHGPIKINEEVYKEQFGARSKNWHDSAVWITHQELLQKHAALCEVSPDSIALDVCCGSGVVGAAFRPKVKKIVGLDLTPQMVALAKTRLDEVHQGNVYNLPFQDNQFDLVCTREVLHLLPEPERPVSEIFRVLKPGGQFIVGQILPFSESDAVWMYRVFKKKQPLIFNMFQEQDFREMLLGAGFSSLQMTEINVWESIDVWINSYETTNLHRFEIRELFKNAPAEVRAVHPFKILPTGEIQDLWRWCIFSVRKPL